MDVITLLKNFTFVGQISQSWATDWIAVPPGFQNWQLVVVVKSLLTGANMGYILQTTWDTDSATNTTGTGAANAVGTTITNIASGVGPMVRLQLTATATSSLVLSAYLTPKSE